VRVRAVLATVVWLVAVAAALVLALGALFVALRLDPDSAVVHAVEVAAGRIDLGLLRHGLDGTDAAARSVLFAWGGAALAWLVVGKVLDRLLRP
jgi:hypothetical protein